MSRVKNYYHLIKPGIVFSNTIAVIAGFFFATSVAHKLPIGAFLAVVIGTALIIASACVLNNYIDRDLDKNMKRTKNRALVTGEIKGYQAIIYGVILAVLGFGLLVLGTNVLTVILGFIAYVFYVVIYDWAKRTSEHGTLVGTIPGALPPVAGYVAVVGQLDIATICLFLLWVTWQMAHFYSIAIYRVDEYKAAKVPLITVVRGIRAAKIQIVFYLILFLLASLTLFFAGYMGVVYLILQGVLAIMWLVRGVQLLKAEGKENEQKKARKLFGFSLLVLLAMCGLLAVGGYLF